MREDNKKRNSGFTLVEVLVAVAVLAVAAIPILQSFVSVVQVNSKSRRRLAASTIAEAVMESCKGMSLLEVAAQCNGVGTFTLVYDQGGTSFAGTKSEVEWKSSNSSLSNGVGKSAVGLVSSEYVLVKDSTGFGKGKKFAFWIHGIKSGGGTYDAVIKYELDTTRSKDSFTDAGGHAKSVATEMTNGGINAMRYYKVTVDVYRSTSTRLGTVVQSKPLATMEGSVADASKYQS